jgi:3-oxoacyl-[acyl-carrier protein] reductase
VSGVIKVSWSGLEETVRVEPLAYNSEIFDWFVDNLQKRSMKAVQIHTLVSGRLLYWLNLPFTIRPEWNENEVVRDDLADEPVGRFTLFMPAGRSFGGTGRIGSAVARRLAAAGMGVSIQYRSGDRRAQELASALGDGGRHQFVQCDLLGDDVSDRLAGLRAEVQGVDVLVNAVHGQFEPRPTLEGSWSEDWARHIFAMRLHVEACRVFGAGMVTRAFGRIVLISGSLATRPMVGCGAYAAAKAGLHGFQRVFATEVGRAGVTVNAVAPCRVEPDDERDATEVPERWSALNARVEEVSALPRDPLASEVAAAVGYLVSPAAGAVTGQVIYLARGQVMSA